MKIFKGSWNNIFDYLDAWGQLSVDTREDFLTLVHSNLSISMEFMWKEGFKDLQRVGFIAGNAKRLADELRPFRSAFSSMYEHSIFDDEQPDVGAYIREHLTHQEVNSLAVSRHYHHNSWSDIVHMVTDEAWIKKFLDCPSGAKWNESNSIMYSGVANWFSDEAVFDLLKDMLRRFISGTSPVSFAEMLSWKDYDRDQLSKALTAGVRYLLLFPALDLETLEPLIGVWPNVHARLNRKTPAKPQPSERPPEALEQLDAPFWVHDMTTILVNSSPQALSLRSNDFRFYKRDMDKLLAAIMPLGGTFDEIFSGEQRITHAHLSLEVLGLTDSRLDDNRRMRLFVTPTGQEWLAMPLGEKLKYFLDALRRAGRKKRSDYWEDVAELTMMPEGFNSLDRSYKDIVDLPKKVIAAFDEFQPGQWMRGHDFLQWHVEVNNPLIIDQSKLSHADWRLASRSAQEHLWLQYLTDFIHYRLAPLGCMKTIIDSDSRFWLSITPAGKYLLGSSNDFIYESSDGDGCILIQPNFEIVFTGPNHAAEGELSQYAERVGKGMGTLYKITRQSINAANDAGQDADHIVKRLSTLSDKPIPQNVCAQIKDWSQSYRKVSFKRIQVLVCPDAETALRARSLAPKNALEPISDTVLQVNNTNAVKQLKKKLIANGIGIE